MRSPTFHDPRIILALFLPAYQTGCSPKASASMAISCGTNASLFYLQDPQLSLVSTRPFVLFHSRTWVKDCVQQFCLDSESVQDVKSIQNPSARILTRFPYLWA